MACSCAPLGRGQHDRSGFTLPALASMNCKLGLQVPGYSRVLDLQWGPSVCAEQPECCQAR